MKNLILLGFCFLSFNSFSHYDELTYGDHRLYFQLGGVDFYRAPGTLHGRISDYDIVVENTNDYDICLVPYLKLIKNGRMDLEDTSFIVSPHTEAYIGHYGAYEFGKSWHIRWDYLVSVNLENCAQ